MQNEVTPFFYTTQNNEVKQVRTFSDADGEIWFCAKDVCDVLDIANSRDAVNRLDDDEKMTIDLTGSHSGQRGGAQKLTFTSEPGLYKLIFTSNKPEAKRFSRCVAHEVLPSIRKTGSYSVSDSKEDMKNIKILRKIGAMNVAEKILSYTGLDDFQMALALDKVCKQCTGVSVLELADIRAIEHTEIIVKRSTGTLVGYETKTTWSWEYDYPKDKTDYRPASPTELWEDEERHRKKWQK